MTLISPLCPLLSRKQLVLTALPTASSLSSWSSIWRPQGIIFPNPGTQEYTDATRRNHRGQIRWHAVRSHILQVCGKNMGPLEAQAKWGQLQELQNRPSMQILDSMQPLVRLRQQAQVAGEDAVSSGDDDISGDGSSEDDASDDEDVSG